VGNMFYFRYLPFFHSSSSSLRLYFRHGPRLASVAVFSCPQHVPAANKTDHQQAGGKAPWGSSKCFSRFAASLEGHGHPAPNP